MPKQLVRELPSEIWKFFSQSSKHLEVQYNFSKKAETFQKALKMSHTCISNIHLTKNRDVDSDTRHELFRLL